MKNLFKHYQIAVVMLASVFSISPALAQYPDRPVELIVPWAAGGGTDTMIRAFSDAAKKHSSQPFIVTNKPGATGSIGFAEAARATPDGYKVGVLTAELLIIPHMGIGKVTQEDFIPIARFNSLASAITVRADAPWATVEEFLAQAKRTPGVMKVGNSGVGSIWHLAAAAVQDKAGVQFNHIPFQGGNPAVLALLGGHIDAVTVSTAEVLTYVASGKLKVLAVMSDKRIKGLETVPTLRERNIDLSVGSWAGLGVAKNTPAPVVSYLKTVSAKTLAEPALLETMDKLLLNPAYADDVAFKSQMVRDSEYFRVLVDNLKLKN